MNESRIVELRGEHITLAQALKVAGLVGSGGEGKHLVRSSSVLVNDAPVVQPGRKLVDGDRFRVGDGEEWTVRRPTQTDESVPNEE